jgi:hypothetical protein
MFSVIAEMDEPAEVAYWLGQNPNEASRIASLSFAKAAAELGKIEAKIAANPSAAKHEKPSVPETKAPPPTKTVTGGSARPAKPLEESASQEDYYARRTASMRR